MTARGAIIVRGGRTIVRARTVRHDRDGPRRRPAVDETGQLETDPTSDGASRDGRGTTASPRLPPSRTPQPLDARRDGRGAGAAHAYDRSGGPRPDGRRDWRPRDEPSGPTVRRRALRTRATDTAELLGEDEELIAGRRPVEEAFAARREAVRLLVVPERRAALDQLVIHATTLRIPVVELEGGSLTALAGFDGHQGIALVVKPRPHG